jgi:LmbE family N-acetylglucosaminyl deacetylase
MDNMKCSWSCNQPYLAWLLSFLLFAGACDSGESHQISSYEGKTVSAVLAHPDDETIISGTLTKLSEQDFNIVVIYITSGDDGPDMTGRGLHGSSLAEQREMEAAHALRGLGINDPPVFLGYPDGHVQEHLASIQKDLKALFEEIEPLIVIGFGPDGITGDQDHIAAGVATDSAFQHTEYGRLLLHMALTLPLSPYYANGVPVPEELVDVRVRVNRYNSQRIEAVDAHKTQFSTRVRKAYKRYVLGMRKEKFIIEGNRDADHLLADCF